MITWLRRVRYSQSDYIKLTKRESIIYTSFFSELKMLENLSNFLYEYQNSGNINIIYTFFIALSITIISVSITLFLKNSNEIKSTYFTNFKSTAILLILRFLLAFFCTYSIFHALTKLLLNINLDTLFSITYTPSSHKNLCDLLKEWIVYFISIFNSDPFNIYTALFFTTILFAISSLWYLLTDISIDEEFIPSLVQFNFYFIIIGFIWYYRSVYPYEIKLTFLTEALNFLKESSETNSIPISIADVNNRIAKLKEIKLLTDSLFTTTNFLLFNIIDDWRIINQYRIVTKVSISGWHRIKTAWINYIMISSISLVILLSRTNSELIYGNLPLSYLLSKPVPIELTNYLNLTSSLFWLYPLIIIIIPFGLLYTLIYTFSPSFIDSNKIFSLFKKYLFPTIED